MIRHLLATLLAVFALNAFAAADANRATQAELESVKGIGPALSGKIVKAREAGPFKNWDDLVDRVGGIGPANAGKFSQAGLTVGGATYDGSVQPAKATKGEKSEKTAKEPKEPKASKPRKSEAAPV